MIQKIWQCIKKRDGRTDNPKAICPPTLKAPQVTLAQTIENRKNLKYEKNDIF